MRIATGALRPRNDGSRKNLRVIPRPVRRLVVGIRNTPAQRTRRTDCHTSDIGHWFAMTHYKKCGVSPDGRTEASAPTECNKRCSGRATARVAPTEALQEMRCKPGRATARVAPTEGLPIELRRGRRPRRPAPVTRGAVGRAKKQNRPRLLPRTMRCTVVPPCFAACSRRRPYEVPLHFRAVTGAPVRA